MRKSDFAKVLFVWPIVWLFEKIFMPFLIAPLSWLSRQTWPDFMEKKGVAEGLIIALPLVMAGIGFAAHQAVVTGTAIPRWDSVQIESTMIIGTALLFLLFWLPCYTLSPAVYESHLLKEDPHGERYEGLRRAARYTIVIFWLGCVTWAAYTRGLRSGLVSGAVLFSLILPGIPCLVVAMQDTARRYVHPETKNGQGIEILMWIVLATVVAVFSLFWAI